MEYLQLAIQIMLGISLSACTGFRAFLPLLLVGIFLRLGVIGCGEYFRWISSNAALITFGIATVLESLGDKFAGVDHVLDAIETFIKPVCATILFATVVFKIDPLYAAALGLICGGSVAEVLHLKKASIRLLSTTLTLTMGNPIISLLEDIFTLAATILSILVPVLGFILISIALYFSFRFTHKILGRFKKKDAPRMALGSRSAEG